jgi:hypothetical protein
VPKNARGGWLWEPTAPQEWREYLEEILATKKDAIGKGAWLTLNKKGRSRGSGLGAPRYDELLGSRLPPTQDVSKEDSPNFSDLDGSVLQAQSEFYRALTTGDETAMASIWDTQEDSDVQEFLTLGGSENNLPNVAHVAIANASRARFRNPSTDYGDARCRAAGSVAVSAQGWGTPGKYGDLESRCARTRFRC